MVRTERERERQASIVALNNNNTIDIRSDNTMQQQQHVNVASLKWLI